MHRTIAPPRPPLTAAASARRRGMTLLEFSAALVAISIVLGVCVVASDNLVNDSADRLTVQTMRTLNRALSVFRTEHGVWPSATERPHIDTPAARCIADLRSSPRTEPLVADLPGLTMTPGGWLTVHDGWARPMVYVQPLASPPAATDPTAPPAPPASTEPAASPAAEDHAAQWLRRLPHPTTPTPFFASAGPDGDFGDISSTDSAQRTASLDNLYTFDLESMK